jgi:hypothetical protein
VEICKKKSQTLSWIPLTTSNNDRVVYVPTLTAKTEIKNVVKIRKFVKIKKVDKSRKFVKIKKVVKISTSYKMYIFTSQ